jgi:hypothetical protein
MPGAVDATWYAGTFTVIFTIETVSADNTKTPRFRLKKEIVNKDVASE